MGTYADLLGAPDGRIGPRKFLAIGAGLFVLKFAIDRTIASLAFGRDWSPLNYLLPHESYRLTDFPSRDAAFYLTMIAVALPFVWLGLIVICRRLRDAGLPGWLAVLFFVPVIHWLFFAALSVIPSSRPRREPATTTLPPVAPAATPPTIHGADLLPLDYGRDAEPTSGVRAMMPASNFLSALIAVLLPAPLAVGATLLAAHVMRDYGLGLFVGMPFVVGMVSAVLYGLRTPRTLGQCVRIGLLACVVAGAALIAFALEGLGCLIMLMPLALPIAAMGAALGYAVQSRPGREPGRVSSMLSVTLCLPVLISAEPQARRAPDVFAVTTVIEVAAPPENVWPNVIAFGDITAPPEAIFRAGIAYPLRARIVGQGVGAVRYCEFSTGPFVEPITTWDAPHVLAFDVTVNPPPMREWSPWRIHPPHLSNFLVSHGGQFKLTPLPGGRTRLEGTTWYEHRLWPRTYWRWWSDFLIHRIHRRVLEHVKALSEKSMIEDGG